MVRFFIMDKKNDLKEDSQMEWYEMDNDPMITGSGGGGESILPIMVILVIIAFIVYAV
jgi:hypothetical protein